MSDISFSLRGDLQQPVSNVQGQQEVENDSRVAATYIERKIHTANVIFWHVYERNFKNYFWNENSSLNKTVLLLKIN